MTAAEPVAVRQAALLLHGLPVAVRERVLAKLEPAQMTRLAPLLAELDTLRIPRSLGDELQRLATSATGASDGDETFPERVDRLPPELVEHCLRSCAPVTVARLLCARDWSWRGALLARLSGARRLEVSQYLRKDWPALAPAVLASLCERLCLEAARPHVGTHFLRRWFAWIP